MLVMVVFFIAFRWIHLSTPLIRLFLLVLILLLMPTLNFLPGWFALSLLRFLFFSSRRRHTRCSRDWSQTCALPISSSPVDNSWLALDGDFVNEDTGLIQAFELPIEYYHGVEDGESWSEGSHSNDTYVSALPEGKYTRSEERRVGKECRSRWSPYH